MNFWFWLESQKIESTDKNVENFLLSQKEVRDFLSKIDQLNLIKPEIGKKGYLIINRGSQFDPFTGTQYYQNVTGNSYQHRIPVSIVNIIKNEVEVAREDNKDFSEISYKAPYYPDPKTKKTIIVPLNRITIVKQDQYRTYLKWLAYAIKKGSEDNKISIPKFFNRNWNKIENQLVSSLSNSQIQSKFKTTELDFSYFQKEFPDVPKTLKGGKGADGAVVEQFPNGFKWISLGRESCEKEGTAGGHCGNAGDPRPGDNILSLRDKDNKVYLTFVINNGTLTERKANGNKKPPKELHPYILSLLKNPIVKHIGPGKYLKENDFQLSDLDSDHLVELKRTRPDLAGKISKIDLAFAKYQNNPHIVIKKLLNKWTELKNIDVTDYDKSDSALIIGNGEFVVEKADTEWKKVIASSLEFNKNNYDLGSTLNDAIVDLPSHTYATISEYLQKSTKLDLQNFKDLFWKAMKSDKNFNYFIISCIKKAHRRSVIDGFNEILKDETNEAGIYYKLRTNNQSYILAYKQLKTTNIKDCIKIFKNEGDKALELSPHLPYVSDIQIGYLTEEINNNIKMLFYRTY